MTPLAWVTALVVMGLAALVLEVFVPSGGVLGFLSLVALASGVALAFIEQGPWIGTAVLAVTCVAVPIVLAAAFQVFPETPLGRRVLPPPPSPDDVVPDAGRRAALKSLVGCRGVATTELVPWGVIGIDGIPHDAFSEMGPIAAGAAVEVVGVQGTAMVVRGAAPAPSSRPASGAESAEVPRGLEEALESFDFDALDRGSEPRPSVRPDQLDSPPTRNNA
jgi:membrane-bound serine protease (ClpP class)